MRQTGARIEQLLTELRSAADPETVDRAEDLVRLLVQLYGGGLERIVELVGAAAGGSRLMTAMAEDELVGSLLILHELHPHNTERRVLDALEKVRPFLGSHSGDVEYIGITEDGVLRLKLAGSCNGCPSSTVTVKMAIETAVEKAAPEIVGVEVEGVAAPPQPGLLQIAKRQEYLTCPVPEAVDA
jgi:Fe-S cluster biogenesis protein NfuA